MSKTQIDISGAIAKRRREIKQLMTLKHKVQRLIADSIAAEDGTPCMPRSEWEKLKSEVEAELFDLNMARIVHGVIPQISGLSGIPTHWSMAEII